MMWFEKKKCPFPKSLSFQFWHILKLKNLETSESFRLFQLFIASVAKLNPFTESEINVWRQINKDHRIKEASIYACFFLNDVNGFLRNFLKITGALVKIHLRTNIPF